MPDIDVLAARLDEARRTGRATPQLSGETDLTIDDAYAVQAAGVRLREARGERVVGAKLGLTSKAKARQMGVEDVIIGVVTDVMAVENGAEIDVSGGIHPRIEPEVAFRLSREIDPTAVDVAQLRDAVDAVAPALEIIDSRYENFRFDLGDVVADNTSASGFVVGPWFEFEGDGPDLSGRAVTMAIDGEEVASGSTTDILDDPWEAIPAIHRMAAAHGQALPAGSVLLAGAATAAVALPAGARVVATVEGLGEVSVRTAGDSRG